LKSSTILVLVIFCTAVFAACDCGYLDVQDPTSQVWTTYWESNFTTMSSSELAKGFRFMVKTIQHPGGDSRMFTQSNVAIDSNGLHLSVQPVLSNGDIPSGGIYTKSVFGFGSYHFEAQSTNVAGTVQAFYVYLNDNNEVDMEHVSQGNSSSEEVNFSVKPQVFLSNGQASSTTLQQVQPSFDLAAGFHNYSFVWNSSSIEFGIDNNWSSQIVTNVPQAPGALSISLWSDGNPNYSGGPPTSTATLTVSRLWVFYNATGASLPCKETNAPCSGSQVVASKSNAPHLYMPRPAIALALLMTIAFAFRSP